MYFTELTRLSSVLWAMSLKGRGRHFHKLMGFYVEARKAYEDACAMSRKDEIKKCMCRIKDSNLTKEDKSIVLEALEKQLMLQNDGDIIKHENIMNEIKNRMCRYNVKTDEFDAAYNAYLLDISSK